MRNQELQQAPQQVSPRGECNSDQGTQLLSVDGEGNKAQKGLFGNTQGNPSASVRRNLNTPGPEEDVETGSGTKDLARSSSLSYVSFVLSSIGVDKSSATPTVGHEGGEDTRSNTCMNSYVNIEMNLDLSATN